jgi:hypothetical protein
MLCEELAAARLFMNYLASRAAPEREFSFANAGVFHEV